MSATIYFLFIASMTSPFRSRSVVSATMFASFDRPEDRPHTMLWLTTQVAAGFAVLIPVGWFFQQVGLFELTYIPVLVNGIGDGLAEPVGVRFGRRSYKTFVGSACVLVTGIAVVPGFRDAFTTTQLIVAFFSIPISLTFAESVAPHTWDTPVLFLVGGLVNSVHRHGRVAGFFFTIAQLRYTLW